ncbi:unnamed protein product [Urochloa decumbens]|uniref:Uncharacterized protein n=1 Tax=Urochloa decumbens TaxID=240449 RepID=A0ABC9D165_9POAL
MAASRGSPGPWIDTLETEESENYVPIPSKRAKIGVAATELVGGSTEDEKQQRKTAAAAGGVGPSSASPATPTINNPPLPVRYPPFPKPHPRKTAWELRMSKLNKRDPRRNLPTVMRPPDLCTARSVLSSRDKAVIRDVARSTLHIRLPNKTLLEGELLFIDEHYDIALLEISSESDLPLQVPSFGSTPNYGQEVFVLARDIDLYMMARPGKIEWLEKSDYLGRNCHMFLSCELPLVGTGGSVIDLDGNVTGMVFKNYSSNPHIIAMSTILTCMEMWMKFSRIAHPIHGLRLRTVDLLDVSLQEVLLIDHNINNGYIVDEVSVGSAAERLGIRSAEVIVSFDGLRDHTLPQLEDFLLSLGWRFLQRSTDSSSTVDVKLEVYDLLGQRARTITLPVGFFDASEMVVEEEKEEEEEEEKEEEGPTLRRCVCR